MPKKPPLIAIHLPQFYNGGIERVMVNLARDFTRSDIRVDFVLNRLELAVYSSEIPPQTRLIDLQAKRFSQRLPYLMKYLEQERPRALLSAFHYTNEIALLAKQFTRTPTRVVVSVHNTLSVEARAYPLFSSRRWIPTAAKLLYGRADGIVTVSQGVKRDLMEITGLGSDRIETIYNPIITPELITKSQEPLDHPWFTPGNWPVILAVGRLEPQKDFVTLIQAFAKVRQRQPSRLMILGAGKQQTQLTQLIEQLNLEQDAVLHGFVSNPFPYMARAAVFVLSSTFEGFGNVIVEAMALNTPIVSTDCPSGPSEILAQGRYGELVPVKDSEAMARAILKVLSGQTKTVDAVWTEQFTVECIARKYLEVLGVV